MDFGGFTDFGKYLVQQRELRGLSREDVSQATKIPPSLLKALETGQAERLPERVFVVNFLKAYAQVVGLEQDEVLLRFEEVADERPVDLAPVEEPGEKNKRVPRGLAIGIGVGLAAAGFASWWFQRAG